MPISHRFRRSIKTVGDVHTIVTTVPYNLGRFIHFTRRLPINVAEVALYAAAPRMWPSDLKRGFRILDPNPRTRPDFVRVIDGALALIEQNDPLRFGRVRREVRMILHMPVIHAGRYFRPFRVCRIDLRCFSWTADAELALRLLACLIVHEATHGHLFTRRVLQTKRCNLRRVESLCWKEEVRFARRLGFDYSSYRPSDDALTDAPLRERLRFAADAFKRQLP